MKLDDRLLVAYVDGEVDPATAREVEAALQHDLDARLRVEAFRESAELVSAAYSDPSARPVQERVIAALDRPGRPRHRRASGSGLGLRRYALPLAASIAAFAIGFGLSSALDDNARKYELATTSSELWLDEIVSYFQVYAADSQHLVELGAERRPYIEAWLSRRLDHDLRVPDLSAQGLTFRGARLMAAMGQPTAMLAYERSDGGPIGLCITRYWEESRQPPTVFENPGAMPAVYWTEGDFAYVLIGDPDPERLQGYAAAIAPAAEPAAPADGAT